MITLTVISYVLSISYAVFYLVLLYGLVKIVTKKRYSGEPQKLSVIIAARNEEDNIESLLQALISQNYSNESYEVVIANDRSTDTTATILEEYSIKYPELVRYVTVESQKPNLIGKKNALTEAIAISKHDILVFTDADCTPDSEWLSEMNKAFTGDVDFVGGYSPLILDNKFNQNIKNLERAFFFGISAGSFGLNLPLTVTGRNMAYRKSLFEKVNGYSGIGTIRSGDDDLMMFKLAPYIRNYSYLLGEEGIVPSKDRSAINDQVNLETRRYSKLRYHPRYLQVTSGLVFLFFILLLIDTILFALGVMDFDVWFRIIIIKSIGELLFITNYLKLIGRTGLIKTYPILGIYYVIHFLWFGLKGTFGNYKWK